MSFWADGGRDLSRRCRRLFLLVRLISARRGLAKAETDLGILGWQQADFLTPEMQTQAQRIMDFEREEASLLNREAELTGQISELERLRTAAREEASAVRRELETQAKGLAAERRDGRAFAEQRREHLEQFDRALSELEREHSGLEIVANKLRAFDTRQSREECERALARRRLLAHEMEELCKARAGKSTEIIDVEEKLAWSQQRWDAVEKELSESRASAAHEERRFSHETSTLERERRQHRKIADALDKDKRSPFQVIGRCLAESGIAPMNQPEALERVIAVQNAVREMEEKQAALNARLAEANRTVLLLFYGSILIALIITAILFSR